MSNQSNPLVKYMRQPKIYIQLPSQGRFWPEGSLNSTVTGEYPVYGMTGKDEIMFKTPDALLNGQAIVDVIQSCVPDIKNAWVLPVLDLDAVLIAIRLATYGERMTLNVPIPGRDAPSEASVDLKLLLDQTREYVWEDELTVDDLKIYVRPLTYQHFTKTSIKTFEADRAVRAISDNTIDEQTKLGIFTAAFKKLTDLTTNSLIDSVYMIRTPDTEVRDVNHISEFLNNVDSRIIQAIQNHISLLKERNQIKPLIYHTTEEERTDTRVPETISIPVIFDSASFFAPGS